MKATERNPYFFLLVLSLLLFSSVASAQTYEQIKSNPGKYIFAEGTASTAKEAENAANAEISQQINLYVSASFRGETSSAKSSTLTAGKNTKGKGTVSVEGTSTGVTETYSQVQLINCRKIIRQNGEKKKYVIFKYIEKSEIDRLFKAREKKVLEYLTIALEAEKELKIDAALKYYSWARYLLETLLRPNELKFNYEGQERYCSAWIPAKISQVLDDLDFKFNSYIDDKKDYGIIDVTYKGKPVSSLDFTYYDGVSWCPMVQAKDGKGAVEFRTDIQTKFINVQVEYNYESEAKMDKEIAVVMEKAEPFVFENAYKKGILIPVKEKEIKKSEKKAMPAMEEAAGTNNTAIFLIEDPSSYAEKLDEVLSAIKSKNYSSVSTLFTEEGYRIFDKLIHYGNAKIMNADQVKFLKLDDAVFCRSVPMVFSFSNNTKKFVENVVFEFNKDGKIDNIMFAVESSFVQDVMSKDSWTPEAKMILVNFLENYKTSFALKRLDYISSIFSDDALIITGRVVKKTVIADSERLNGETIKYTKQTKSQYIKNLSYSFNSKEYINLKFSNIEVSRITKGFNPNFYSIQLRQDYFSSNYGDTGYLLLMADLGDAKHPVIHIRTWQPEPDPKFGVYSPASDIFSN